MALFHSKRVNWIFKGIISCPWEKYSFVLKEFDKESGFDKEIKHTPYTFILKHHMMNIYDIFMKNSFQGITFFLYHLNFITIIKLHYIWHQKKDMKKLLNH
jgi:hypothetical protein